MSLLGFKAKNHPQQVGPRGVDRGDLLPGLGEFFTAAPADVTDDVDDRAVPEGLFAAWQERFRFTVDVAANHHNAKLPRYFTKESSGLDVSWSGERVYCNPPFSAIGPWVEKAWAETGAQLIVMLLPANRTEQAWWQRLIEPERDGRGGGGGANRGIHGWQVEISIARRRRNSCRQSAAVRLLPLYLEARN